MSESSEHMTDQPITIEVNGRELQARPGQMLIEVTDEAGIYIPRFCYHPKLSVAANCRMCLVEVENAPKPMPACATPVNEGMRVFTASPKALDAQRATMEFLLINHPLDCPICDQGGECELQDLAMGYGRDISRYNEGKRVVRDKDLGSLISTDMTRCIHCTRCVRFTEEIAGFQELGTLGRGENLEIGTYIERAVDHELSGNVIDLCPVGALNSKPYRFGARAWEMVQKRSVSPHDCAGSNLYVHVLRDTLKRVVPAPNEDINETWLSDRDRFSYQGVYADDRLTEPMIKDDGKWRSCGWDEALDRTVAGLNGLTRSDSGDHLAAWVSPSSTTEEAWLLSRIVNHAGSANIDHRLRRQDFRAEDQDPVFPWLGCGIAELEHADAIVVVGSNLRREVPVLAHRVRKAALAGCQVSFINSGRFEYFFPVRSYFQVPEADMSSAMEELALDAGSDPNSRAIFASLKDADNGLILLGQMAMRHPDFSVIRRAAFKLAQQQGVRLGYLSEGANAAGVSLAGALPHRGVGGTPSKQPGLNISEQLQTGASGVIMFGLEPEHDVGDAQTAIRGLHEAEFVVAFTPFAGESLLDTAHVLLPIGTFAETDGSYVNAEGRWQSFDATIPPLGEARPGWKVLRVLANRLGVADCEYLSAAQICEELQERIGEIRPDNTLDANESIKGASARGAASDDLDVPMYRIDPLARRAKALQEATDPGEAGRHKLLAKTA